MEIDGYWTLLECGREVWTGYYYFGCCWDINSIEAIALDEVTKRLMKREKRKVQGLKQETPTLRDWEQKEEPANKTAYWKTACFFQQIISSYGHSHMLGSNQSFSSLSFFIVCASLYMQRGCYTLTINRGLFEQFLLQAWVCSKSPSFTPCRSGLGVHLQKQSRV